MPNGNPGAGGGGIPDFVSDIIPSEAEKKANPQAYKNKGKVMFGNVEQ